MSLVPRQIFQKIVDKYKGDYRVRDFTCSNHLRFMVFGQSTSCKPLKDTCLCLNAFKALLYGLGITSQRHTMSQHSLGPMKIGTITSMKD